MSRECARARVLMTQSIAMRQVELDSKDESMSIINLEMIALKQVSRDATRRAIPCVYACVCVARVCMCMYVCVRVYEYVYVCVRVCTCVRRMCVRACMHAHVY